MTGTLHIVATPIGNLADLSHRAEQVLSEVDVVAAEDTRYTGLLLDRLGIRAQLLSLHEHSDQRRLERVLDLLLDGRDVALVSDAGTPLISDPGFELVRAARQRGIPVLPVPGACALTAALSVSGLPTDRFLFCGFLPSRAGARRGALEELRAERATLVFYESARRLAALLEDARSILGSERAAFLAREMTKRHEQYLAAPLGTLGRLVAQGEVPLKGECVLVLAGAPEALGDAERAAARLLALLAAELPPSRAARVASRFTGLPRARCFELTRGRGEAEGSG